MTNAQTREELKQNGRMCAADVPDGTLRLTADNGTMNGLQDNDLFCHHK